MKSESAFVPMTSHRRRPHHHNHHLHRHHHPNPHHRCRHDHPYLLSREERRAIERLNRANRSRLRAEELRTVRKVVELARTHDPRLIAANKAAREEKAAKRQARLDAIQKRREQDEEVRHR